MSERPGVVAAVRLDDADDDVALLVLGLEARGLEHRVRLADAGRGAEEDRELAARCRRAPPRATRASSSSGSGRSSVIGRTARSQIVALRAVEREVQLEDVDARLAEDAERAALGVAVDERAHAALVEPARLRDALHLVLRPRRARCPGRARCPTTSRGRRGSGACCPGPPRASASMRPFTSSTSAGFVGPEVRARRRAARCTAAACRSRRRSPRGGPRSTSGRRTAGR